MQKIPRKPRLRGVPRIAFAAALTALTLWTVGVAATAHSLSDAAERLRQETALPLALLRYEMGGEEADELSLGASLALSLTPILADAVSWLFRDEPVTGKAASAGSSSSQGMAYTPSNSSSKVEAG